MERKADFFARNTNLYESEHKERRSGVLHAIWTEEVSQKNRRVFAKMKHNNYGTSISCPVQLLQTAAADCRLVHGDEYASIYVLLPVRDTNGDMFNIFVDGDSFIEHEGRLKKNFIFDDYLYFSEYTDSIADENDDYAALSIQKIYTKNKMYDFNVYLLTEDELAPFIIDEKERLARLEESQKEYEYICYFCREPFTQVGRDYSDRKQCYNCFVVRTGTTLVG